MHEREGKIIYKFLKYCYSMKAQNTEDIFTLEKVEPPYFYFIQEENIIYKYNAKILADFIEESACYKDPQTQIVYNDIELKRLEKMTNRSLRGIVKENNENENNSVIPFLENEVGESIRLILEHNNVTSNSNIQLNEIEEWYNLLQSLNEIKQIGMEYYQTVMNTSITNLKHEEQRLFKQTRLYYIMLRHGKKYDYLLDDKGNIIICEEDKVFIPKYFKTMHKFIVCKTLIKDLSRQLYFQSRFQDLMLRLNALPTIYENSSLV
tara:strand:- start:252 stop:1043 length:792 start_codon:yes stop_codon:yes gene_type:complete